MKGGIYMKIIFLTICLTINLLLCISDANDVLAAQLGAGKAVKTDNGPSLEETMNFIKDKLPQWHANKWETSEFNGSTLTESPNFTFSNDKCNVIIKEDTIDNNTMFIEEPITGNEWVSGVRSKGRKKETSTFQFKKIREFNLKDVVNIMNDTYQGAMYNGSVIISINIKTNKDSIKCSTNEYVSNCSQCDIPMKSKEYSKRMTDAFSHAVKLCGGGKDLDKIKKDLF
jgi:hypothetical protein